MFVFLHVPPTTTKLGLVKFFQLSHSKSTEVKIFFYKSNILISVSLGIASSDTQQKVLATVPTKAANQIMSHI